MEDLKAKIFDAVASAKTGNKTVNDAVNQIIDLTKPQRKNPLETIVMCWANVDLGTRFRYVGQTEIWTKLDRDLVARFDPEYIYANCRWTGQSICNAASTTEELQNLVVEVIPNT